MVDNVGPAGLPCCLLSFLTSGAWWQGARRVNWDRFAGVIYDKFASRSPTYASKADKVTRTSQVCSLG